MPTIKINGSLQEVNLIVQMAWCERTRRIAELEAQLAESVPFEALKNFCEEQTIEHPLCYDDETDKCPDCIKQNCPLLRKDKP